MVVTSGDRGPDSNVVPRSDSVIGLISLINHGNPAKKIYPLFAMMRTRLLSENCLGTEADLYLVGLGAKQIFGFPHAFFEIHVYLEIKLYTGLV